MARSSLGNSFSRSSSWHLKIEAAMQQTASPPSCKAWRRPTRSASVSMSAGRPNTERSSTLAMPWRCASPINWKGTWLASSVMKLAYILARLYLHLGELDAVPSGIPYVKPGPSFKRLFVGDDLNAAPPHFQLRRPKVRDKETRVSLAAFVVLSRLFGRNMQFQSGEAIPHAAPLLLNRRFWDLFQPEDLAVELPTRVFRRRWDRDLKMMELNDRYCHVSHFSQESEKIGWPRSSATASIASTMCPATGIPSIRAIRVNSISGSPGARTGNRGSLGSASRRALRYASMAPSRKARPAKRSGSMAWNDCEAPVGASGAHRWL